MVKIQFIGVGSMFSGADQYHSNILIIAASGKIMLIDCGSDVRFALAEINVPPNQLDAVYISHLHADHIGGLEWLALNALFNAESGPPKLFGEGNLLHRLWANSLYGGLSCINGKPKNLSDYFHCHALLEQDSFHWEDIRFTIKKMPHVVGSECNHYSYGLTLRPAESRKPRIFISTDAIFQPQILEKIATETDLIFHDCETSVSHTGVHAHYEQLRELPISIKQKMWLYHYQPEPEFCPQRDGFLGFVKKGQSFSF